MEVPLRFHLIATTAILLALTACGPKAEPSGEPADSQTWNTDSEDTDTADSDTADTGTADSDTADSDTVVDTDIFAVRDGGYIIAGPWHGYSWARVTGDGSTIDPASFSDLESGSGPLCASGTVGAMANWSGSALIGFNLNQDEDGADAAINAVEVQPGGLRVNISNPGGTEVRIQVVGSTGGATESDRWCFVVSNFNEHVIPWTSFNTHCWDNGGEYYAGQPLTAAAVLVPGHNAMDRPYEVCLEELRPVVEEGGSFELPEDTEADTGGPIDTDLIPEDWNTGFVGAHGALQVDGAVLEDGAGDPVVLRGLSLFWSQWEGDFYNAELVNWLVTDWKINVIRASLGIREIDGYLVRPTEEMEKITTVVNAAIDEGIYVIIDWHAHEADKHPVDARAFFEVMAQIYGDYPNVIYEVWNEPLQDASWRSVIKPYAEYVIEGIRQYDPDNLIVVGTRSWSQEVREVLGLEIDDPNVAYTLHFYAGQHGVGLMSGADIAIANNLPIFITEWGVWSSGYIDDDYNNEVDMADLSPWLDWADENGLSMCMWSVSDKDEPSAIVKPGSSPQGSWTADDLTTIGTLMHGVFNE
jgi:endoglucanase